MNVLFSDLDHTLIYSFRCPIEGEKVLIERLNGKHQSYMTAYAFSFFQEAEWLSLIPVTTRSEAQYRRLLFPHAFHIQYAIICNGGKLLVDGSEDREWSAQTMQLVQNDLRDMELIGDQLRALCGYEIQTPECYYYYVKADDPGKICDSLKNKNPNSNIQIECDHKKVYLFPNSINKGSAVQRFMRKYKTTVSVGAGDSIMDIPMLNEVDYPLVSESLCGDISRSDIIPLAGEIISDQICSKIKDLHLKGIL